MKVWEGKLYSKVHRYASRPWPKDLLDLIFEQQKSSVKQKVQVRITNTEKIKSAKNLEAFSL